MAKMQNFKFNSLVEFYDFLNEDHRQITLVLEELMTSTLPEVKTKLSWNVPFFYDKKTICFIWPGCVPWGNSKKEGVELGFAQGYKLEDPHSFLEQGKRKQVFLKTFYSLEEVEESVEILIDLIRSAGELDKE